MFCSIACVYALILKRDGRLTSLALTSALLFGAALELFDLLAILNPEDLLFWKRFSLGTDGLLIFSWLLFSVVYDRCEGFLALSVRQKVALAITAWVLFFQVS